MLFARGPLTSTGRAGRVGAMRGAASPWRHTPPTPKAWPIAVAGEVVAEVDAVSPAEAASAWFRSQAADGRFPLRCSVGPYVFRNSNKPPMGEA